MSYAAVINVEISIFIKTLSHLSTAATTAKTDH